MAKRNLNQYATQAKTWATGHLVAAAAISAAIGFALGALLL